MNTATLEQEITALFEQGSNAPKDVAREVFHRFRVELASGRLRAAEPEPASPTGWRVNVWVKQGILVGFRCGDVVDMSADGGKWSFFDKDTLPMKGGLTAASGVRIVPGARTARSRTTVPS